MFFNAIFHRHGPIDVSTAWYGSENVGATSSRSVRGTRRNRRRTLRVFGDFVEKRGLKYAREIELGHLTGLLSRGNPLFAVNGHGQKGCLGDRAERYNSRMKALLTLALSFAITAAAAFAGALENDIEHNTRR
jgi:hypothetical protein